MKKVNNILLIIFYVFVIFCLLFYIDFNIISPLILPKDLCYYHLHDTPLWVEVLYMNCSSNEHPEWSIIHIILLLILSIFLGDKIKKRIHPINETMLS